MTADPLEAMKEVESLMAEAIGKAKKATAKAVAALAQTVFDANDKVAKIVWRQYAPYFNDGEPCHFSIHEAGVVLSDGSSQADGHADDEDDEEDDYDGGDILYSWDLESDRKLDKALSRFNRKIQDWDEHLETAFGEHATVTVYRDGEVVVEEYTDHD